MTHEQLCDEIGEVISKVFYELKDGRISKEALIFYCKGIAMEYSNSILTEVAEEIEENQKKELFVGSSDYKFEKGNMAFVYNLGISDSASIARSKMSK